MRWNKKAELPHLSEEGYFAAFDRPIPAGDSRHREALRQALDTRKFEIDLYWRRATYFWGFIAAALAAYSLLQRSKPSENQTQLSILFGALGFVFSFAWFCVNRGSKQWQENWENHVDLLEDEITGPLYKTTLRRPDPVGRLNKAKHFLTGPADFSVSKVNQIVSLFVTLLWVPIIGRALPPFSRSAGVDLFVVAVLSLAGLAALGVWFVARSDQRAQVHLRKTKPIA